MKVLRIVPVCLFAWLLFFLGRGLLLDPQKIPTAKIGKMVPFVNLPQLLTNHSQRFTQDLLHGHMSILVVWASWCETCREEQAFLMELAKQKGFVLYGLNYKDDPQDARQWLVDWGNPYQAVAMDQKGKFALDLGVYGTPETYLIDQNGIIKQRYVGALSNIVWQQEFVPLLGRGET